MHQATSDHMATTALPAIADFSGISERRLRAMPVTTDYMAPEFRRGDIAIVDIGDNQFGADGTYVIWTGVGLEMRKINRVPNSYPGEAVLTAGDDRVNRCQFRCEDLDIEGRVIGKWEKR